MSSSSSTSTSSTTAPKSPNGRLQGRIALVTGASRGIGAAVAVAMAKEGAHVLLAARTIGGLEAVDDQIRQAGGTASIIPINLLKLEQVDQLGAAIFERYGYLDIAVANAGMLGYSSPITHTQPKEWDKIITVNLTANYRLIRTLDPLLRASKAGRLIGVTSEYASSHPAYFGAYSVSKAGLEALFNTYAHEVEQTPIKVHLIDPGAVDTTLYRSAFPGDTGEAINKPEAITEPFVELATA